MIWTLKAKLYAVAVALIVAVVGVYAYRIYEAGKAAERAKALQAQVAAQQRAADVSRETAEARAAEQTQTQQEAQRVETIIRERIVRVPAPAGTPDSDIMRAVADAHAAAVCAARRVQRAECSPAPAAASAGD